MQRKYLYVIRDTLYTKLEYRDTMPDKGHEGDYVLAPNGQWYAWGLLYEKECWVAFVPPKDGKKVAEYAANSDELRCPYLAYSPSNGFYCTINDSSVAYGGKYCTADNTDCVTRKRFEAGNPMPDPRAYTADEVRGKLVNYIHVLVTDTLKHKDKTPREQLELLAFSILSTLDGSSVPLPGFKVIPAPCPEDKEHYLNRGKKYFPDDVDIGGALHGTFAGKKQPPAPTDGATAGERCPSYNQEKDTCEQGVNILHNLVCRGVHPFSTWKNCGLYKGNKTDNKSTPPDIAKLYRERTTTDENHDDLAARIDATNKRIDGLFDDHDRSIVDLRNKTDVLSKTCWDREQSTIDVLEGHAKRMDILDQKFTTATETLVGENTRQGERMDNLATDIYKRLAAIEKRTGQDGIIMQRLGRHKDLIHDSGSATLKALAEAENRLGALEAAVKGIRKTVGIPPDEVKAAASILYDNDNRQMVVQFHDSGHKVVIAHDPENPCPKGKFMVDTDGKPLRFACMITGNICYHFVDEETKYQDCDTYKKRDDGNRETMAEIHDRLAALEAAVVDGSGCKYHGGRGNVCSLTKDQCPYFIFSDCKAMTTGKVSDTIPRDKVPPDEAIETVKEHLDKDGRFAVKMKLLICPHASPEPTLVESGRVHHTCAVTGNHCLAEKCQGEGWRECEMYLNQCMEATLKKTRMEWIKEEYKGEEPRWTGDVCPFYDYNERDVAPCQLKQGPCKHVTRKDANKSWKDCEHLKDLCPHFDASPIKETGLGDKYGHCKCDDHTCLLEDAKRGTINSDKGTTCPRALGRVRVEKDADK